MFANNYLFFPNVNFITINNNNNTIKIYFLLRKKMSNPNFYYVQIRKKQDRFQKWSSGNYPTISGKIPESFFPKKILLTLF